MSSVARWSFTWMICAGHGANSLLCIEGGGPVYRTFAAAAVGRIRELHTEQQGTCLHCGYPWECPTIRALDGPGLS